MVDTLQMISAWDVSDYRTYTLTELLHLVILSLNFLENRMCYNLVLAWVGAICPTFIGLTLVTQFFCSFISFMLIQTIL